MAKYRHYSYDQGVMIPVDFSKQIVPGTIEYTVHWLVENKIDLGGIETKYRNDNTGAPAYNPAILLKIVLLAYSRGIISSRKIMEACRENIVFMALSADSMPDFTTIAAFVRLFIGNHFAGYNVGIRENKSIMEIWFDDFLIGVVDKITGLINYESDSIKVSKAE